MALVFKKINEYDKALPLAREPAQLAHKTGFPDVAKYDKLVADLEKAVGQWAPSPCRKKGRLTIGGPSRIKACVLFMEAIGMSNRRASGVSRVV
jgi:hypothetical protein